MNDSADGLRPPALQFALQVDASVHARAKAYATAAGTTLDALLARHLHELADGLVAAPLPRGAVQDRLLMFTHGGRDTTARYLRDGAWDEFERPMPAAVFAWTARNPGLVVDGGANTGFYTLLAAAAAAGSQVLAFEPDPAVHELLRANVDASGFGGRVSLSTAALSDAEGRAALYVPTRDHGLVETSSSLESGFKSRYSEVLEVETVTLDRVIQHRGAGGPRVTLVKLDLAGHEAAALAGAARTVAADRPVIFVEVLDRADFGALSSFVARLNYMDVPLTRGRLVPQTTVAFEPSGWNHAFVPAEVLPAFLSALRQAA